MKFSQKFNSIFLIGDHGHRLHPIRQTYAGILEHRLPFLGMMVPRLLLSKNKLLATTLKLNTLSKIIFLVQNVFFILLIWEFKVLTSWWDLYETILHLLLDQDDMNLNESTYLTDRIQKRENEPKNGLSLFLPLPYRTCEEGGVPSHFCACNIKYEAHSDPKIVDEAAKFLINSINKLLRNYENLCSKVVLTKILDSKKIYNVNKYSLIFETSPNNAVFDATVSVKEGFELVSKITRLNMYGRTSYCVDSIFLRNYCYCIKQLNVSDGA